MAGFLELLVSNVASALVLAILALVAARLVRRPALVHGLWLLVLVKLVTPPIIPLQFTQPEWVSELARENLSAATAAPAGSLPNLLPGVEPSEIEWATPEIAAAGEGESWRDRAMMSVQPTKASVSPGGLSGVPLSTLLAGMLLVGSAVVFLITWHRVRNFNRALRRAGAPSRELLSEIHSVGRRIGVRQVPTVLLVPGCISPMLWSGLGRARLILPEDLVRGLTENERRTLIAHELAHFRRGDHMVRLLELAATLLYWWCPLLYAARRRLRQAEEECCDAWVLWAEPGEVRSYAGALLQTIDFMSRNGRLLPPVASGISGGRFLKRRVEMIMSGRTPRSAGILGRSMLVLLAALALPLVPAWAQDPVRAEEEVTQEKPETRRTRTRDVELRRLEERLRRLERKNEELQREQRRRTTRDDRERRRRREVETRDKRRLAERDAAREWSLIELRRREAVQKAEELKSQGRVAEARDLLKEVNGWREDAARARLEAQHKQEIKRQLNAQNALARARQRIMELEKKLAATREVGDLDAASRLEEALAASKATLDAARTDADAMAAQRQALEQNRKMLEQKLRLREQDAADVLAVERRDLEARKNALQAERRWLEEQARQAELRDPHRNRPPGPRASKGPLTRQQRIRMLEKNLEKMQAQMQAMMHELQKLRSEQKAERKGRRSLDL